ncbi:endoplasmic reticulum membrane sensor NFE2L1a [Chanos chanos]|uniref:Endoplasmic reticulum membrane sensor NFE2L1 n=1 Tax=Chanos chanos TaxID=29144 RepID=A0A6J2WZF9_CHACN|nr:endoplasmic reticulum membrane sensor NFE2L1-like [Chanos chanos]
MLYLKKYLTEGLIQVAILLSLVGMRVDVDPYLPPLREIIRGPSSALTQTQFHNLRNSLEGYGIHPKSVDLDEFFSNRRLLSWVRSLDRLRVPAAELETWLVHRETDNLVSIPAQTGSLEVSSGLEDIEENSGLITRMGSEDAVADLGYGPALENGLGAGASLSREPGQDNRNDLNREEMDESNLPWQQGTNHGSGQGPLYHGNLQYLGSFDEGGAEEENQVGTDVWRDRDPFPNQMSRTFGDGMQDQFNGLEVQNSQSLEECLQLLEANFPLGQEPESSDPYLEGIAEEDQFSTQRPLLSPFLPQEEPILDLEQQWQDLLAIMEPQDMDVDHANDDTFLSVRGADGVDDSRHHASLPRSHGETCPFISVPEQVPGLSNHFQPSLNNLTLSTSSCLDPTFDHADIDDLFLPLASAPNSTETEGGGRDDDLSNSFLEDQAMSAALSPFLEGAMLDEISLMDLALEEGFNQTQVSQLQDQIDSDSGLSLDFSQSPVSPSGSESSCTSSSSLCSSSSFNSSDSSSEEGAVGYSHNESDITYLERGAVGGPGAEQDKVSNLRDFQRFPWLNHIGHDHTYIQPHHSNSNQRKSSVQSCSDPAKHNSLDKPSSRDERRANAMKIPFSNDRIINLPVEEFNELLAKYRLSEAQLTLIRDIRRRGKNKLAAQNCRRRKLDVLLGLEHSVNGLRRRRAQLLREKSEVLRSVKEMKQRLHDLYQEVFDRIRNEQERLCLPDDYIMPLDGNSNSMLSSQRGPGSDLRRKSNKRQKDKKK